MNLDSQWGTDAPIPTCPPRGYPPVQHGYPPLQGALPTLPTKPAPVSPNDVQVGGDHYKSKAIQPWDYIEANNMDFFEGNALKYLTRWKVKGGVSDLKKAIHYIQKIVERAEKGDYDVKTS